MKLSDIEKVYQLRSDRHDCEKLLEEITAKDITLSIVGEYEQIDYERGTSGYAVLEGMVREHVAKRTAEIEAELAALGVVVDEPAVVADSEGNEE